MKYRYRRHRKCFISGLRLSGIIVAVTIALSGVAFVALQSQQVKLTANLQISSDGGQYVASLSGFDFNNFLVPGGQVVPTTGYSLFLKNAGGTPLALKLAVSTPPES